MLKGFVLNWSVVTRIKSLTTGVKCAAKIRDVSKRLVGVGCLRIFLNPVINEKV